MVDKGLHYGEPIYVNRYHHRIVLRRVNTLEVVIYERDRGHPWSDDNRVYLMHCAKVFLPCIFRVTPSSKSSNNCVYHFPIAMFVVPRRIVPPCATLLASVILSLIGVRSLFPVCSSL